MWCSISHLIFPFTPVTVTFMTLQNLFECLIISLCSRISLTKWRLKRAYRFRTSELGLSACGIAAQRSEKSELLPGYLFSCV